MIDVPDVEVKAGQGNQSGPEREGEKESRAQNKRKKHRN